MVDTCVVSRRRNLSQTMTGLADCWHAPGHQDPDHPVRTPTRIIYIYTPSHPPIGGLQNMVQTSGLSCR